MSKYWVISGAAALAYFTVLNAHATPGGIDSSGCHHSSRIGYHCHPERVKSGGNLPGDGTQANRDRRLKRECKGMSNSGACLGYTR